jgi:hypothetical protein
MFPSYRTSGRMLVASMADPAQRYITCRILHHDKLVHDARRSLVTSRQSIVFNRELVTNLYDAILVEPSVPLSCVFVCHYCDPSYRCKPRAPRPGDVKLTQRFDTQGLCARNILLIPGGKAVTRCDETPCLEILAPGYLLSDRSLPLHLLGLVGSTRATWMDTTVRCPIPNEYPGLRTGTRPTSLLFRKTGVVNGNFTHGSHHSFIPSSEAVISWKPRLR